MSRRVNVLSLRTSLKLSQEDFARRLGVHTRTVQRWENAHYDPSPLASRKLHEMTQPDVPRRRPYESQEAALQVAASPISEGESE